MVKEFDRKCWWCQSEDLSGEHKYKATDLKREYFSRVKEEERSGFKLGLYPQGKWIQGPNSNLVKFGKTLCQYCNNTRSRDFDKAYDCLITVLKENEELLLIKPEISLSEIFTDNTDVQRINLVKYFVKHLCCTLVDIDFAVPDNLIAFLEGKRKLPCIELILSQSIDRKVYLDLSDILTPPASFIGISDLQKSYSRTTGIVDFIHYELYYRSFSFYIKLSNEMREFSSNIFNREIKFITYHEQQFKEENEKLLKDLLDVD